MYITMATSIQNIVDGIKEAISVGSSGDINYITWNTIISVLSRIFSILYLVLSYTIYILVPIIVCLEICYIAFPSVRNGLEVVINRMESKGTSGKVLGATLRDARQAVYEANTLETGKSPYWIYLKLKIKSIQIVMLVIVIVLGYSTQIINMVWSWIQNIISIAFG